MASRRMVSLRAFAFQLLLILPCLIESAAANGAIWSLSKFKRRRPVRSKPVKLKPVLAEKVKAARAKAPTRFVGFNLGDGNSLTVAQLGEYAASVGVTRLKLFHTVPANIKSLSGFKVMAGLQNYELYTFGSATNGYANALAYIRTKIRPYPQVYAIAVGNEPFAEWYKHEYDKLVMPSILNLYKALGKARLARKVNLVVPVDFASIFRAEVQVIMSPILKFLKSTKSPFVVNPYPDWACKRDPIEISYCLGNRTTVSVPGKPASMLAAMVEHAKSLVTKLGYGTLEVQVGETGWPTGDGHPLSTVENQQVFTKGVIKYVREGGASVFIFQLQDGSSDSLGLLQNPSGIPKFPMPTFF